MKEFIKSLQQDADNLVKEAKELREVWGLSGKESYLANKEAMANLNQTEEDEEEITNDYDGSREQALDDYERTEMAAIRNK